jgi:hypothetical protein
MSKYGNEEQVEKALRFLEEATKHWETIKGDVGELTNLTKEQIAASWGFYIGVGMQIAGAEERKRIADWVEENRSAIEIEPGNNMYRDHFNSESLLKFLEEGEAEDGSLS